MRAARHENWFRLFIVCALALAALIFAGGLSFGRSIVHCLSIGGRVALPDWLHGIVLLAFLPVVVVGIWSPRVGAWTLFCLTATALLLAVALDSPRNRSSLIVVGLAMLSTAALLHWRGTSVRDTQGH
jgi:hypothetical protein